MPKKEDIKSRWIQILRLCPHIHTSLSRLKHHPHLFQLKYEARGGEDEAGGRERDAGRQVGAYPQREHDNVEKNDAEHLIWVWMVWIRAWRAVSPSVCVNK